MTPEVVKNDACWNLIAKCVAEFKPQKIIEVGTGTGMGSTQAFISAIIDNKLNVEVTTLNTIEADYNRYKEAVSNLVDHEFVIPWHGVASLGIMSEKEVHSFIDMVRMERPNWNLALYTEKQIMEWYKADCETIKEHGKIGGQLEAFDPMDMVFLDGSAFTGWSDFLACKSAKCIILDDIFDIKNWSVYCELLTNSKYKLIARYQEYRNGCAAFRRVA